MAPYRIAIMKKDIGKFVYGSEQQRTKINEKDPLGIFLTKFLTCNVFVFYKNAPCRLRMFTP